MPKVTVIIPTYRRPAFLHKAILSVINQTYQDFEIIVVDDASNDGTEGVVNAIKDKRLRYICHSGNKGGSEARNTGIENGRGAFIAFLDDDDEWFPKKLELQVKLLENSSPTVGIVYSGCILVEAVTGNVLCQKTPFHRGNLAQRLLAKNIIGTTSSVLIKRECFSRVGFFDESLPSYQDYDMWIRLSKNFHFDTIQEPLVKYHVHEKKIWTNLDALMRGLALMEKKYGCNSFSFKKTFGYYGYLDLGTRYCLNGEIQNGRNAYLEAIRIFPLGMQSYLHFFLTYLGADNFLKIVALKKRLMAPA
jgi:glycosyltransferase involved in cell wall biosynthesis